MAENILQHYAAEDEENVHIKSENILQNYGDDDDEDEEEVPVEIPLTVVKAEPIDPGDYEDINSQAEVQTEDAEEERMITDDYPSQFPETSIKAEPNEPYDSLTPQVPLLNVRVELEEENGSSNSPQQVKYDPMELLKSASQNNILSEDDVSLVRLKYRLKRILSNPSECLSSSFCDEDPLKRGTTKVNLYKVCFDFDRDMNMSTCKVGTCSERITGYHSGNLSRHLKRKHPIIYREIMELKATEEPGTKRQHRDLTIRKMLIRIEMTEEDLWNALVEIVTKNGYPLKLMGHSGFLKIITPVCQGLESKLAVNQENVTKRIVQLAWNYRYEIKESVRGKMLCVLVDLTTFLDRNLLGISVQFSDDFKIKLRNLGVLELEELNPKSINEAVLMKLIDYEIDVRQVLMVLTDDAQNLIDAAQLTRQIKRYRADDSKRCDDSDDEFEDFSLHKSGDEFEEKCATNQYVMEDKCVVLSWQDYTVSSVRCLAYSGGLSLKEILEDKALLKKLDRVRKVVKRLLTPDYQKDINEQNLKRPKLDDMNCWKSTFRMLKRLHSLKEYVLKMDKLDRELKLMKPDWEFVEELLKVLDLVSRFNDKVENERISCGDFYLSWLEMKLSIGKINSTHSYMKQLLLMIDQFDYLFLNNELFCSSIFFDPRLHFLLNDAQKNKAKDYLKHLCLRLKNLKGNNGCTNTDVKSSTVAHSVDSEDDLLEQYLANQAALKPVVSDKDFSISSLINQYSPERQPRSFDVLNYWKQKNVELPLFSELASTILAVPCSRFSMKGNISYLRYVSDFNKGTVPGKYSEYIVAVRINDMFRAN